MQGASGDVWAGWTGRPACGADQAALGVQRAVRHYDKATLGRLDLRAVAPEGEVTAQDTDGWAFAGGSLGKGPPRLPPVWSAVMRTVWRPTAIASWLAPAGERTASFNAVISIFLVENREHIGFREGCILARKAGDTPAGPCLIVWMA